MERFFATNCIRVRVYAVLVSLWLRTVFKTEVLDMALMYQKNILLKLFRVSVPALAGVEPKLVQNI